MSLKKKQRAWCITVVCVCVVEERETLLRPHREVGEGMTTEAFCATYTTLLKNPAGKWASSVSYKEGSGRKKLHLRKIALLEVSSVICRLNSGRNNQYGEIKTKWIE